MLTDNQEFLSDQIISRLVVETSILIPKIETCVVEDAASGCAKLFE
jgi:hypothetical protein